MSKRILSLFLCIFLLLSLCSCSYTTEDNYKTQEVLQSALNVHYIDVGQGDSILLESNDTYVLIDAGEVEYGSTVCDYIKSLGTDTLDYVIATHPHSDHCGGLTDVINTFSCKNFITVETDQQTKTWINVLLAVDENNVNYIDATVGDTYTFGEASFEIMGPYGSDYEDYNDYSVVVKATCGDTSFLFTGDAEAPVEKEMVQNGADLKADVLKVGHHGSYTSSCDVFLDAVEPSYAVITCGVDNEYGHPHRETLQSLSERRVAIYRTDELGTIIAHSDKSTISFSYKNSTQDETIIIGQADDKQSTKVDGASYIGNLNSKKFHHSYCESAKEMKKENRVYFDTREQAVKDGYVPCKSCNP